MNWERMKNSPATRGFTIVARGAVAVAEETAGTAGFLLKITFKPAFMINVQNKEIKPDDLVVFEFVRLVASASVALFSGASSINEWNGQLNAANVAFTLGVAFSIAGLVDMAGLGLQKIGESNE